VSVETKDGPPVADAVRHEDKGPPCRRCGGHAWQVVQRPKGRLRYLLEVAIAAPDVFIFQSDSGGWPSRAAEWWTCLNCTRRVRR